MTTHQRSMIDHLDAALLAASVILLAFVIWVLSFVHVPQENLPILASLASGIFGSVISGYIGFRWGASEAAKVKPQAPGTVTATMTATAETEKPE